MQYVLGRMRYELEVADRVLEATGQIAIDARDADWPVVARKPKWDVVKVVTTEAAMSVTDQAFRLVGGSCAASSRPRSAPTRSSKPAVRT